MSVVAPNIVNTIDVAFRLPLMEKKADAREFATGFGLHHIYVPSNLGGRLTVGLRSPHSDDRLGVVSPDGTTHTRGPSGEIRIDIEARHRGHGVFSAGVLAPSGSYRIFATFEESGAAKDASGNHTIPWNFWYFPYARSEQELSAWGSSVFQPLQKYEKAFSAKGVLEWERAHHNDPTGTRKSWEGHCHNAACASIVFKAPPEEGLRHRGADFTCEELKLLATEFVGVHGMLSVEWTLPFTPPGEPSFHSDKPKDDPKRFAAHGESLFGLLNVLRRRIGIEGHPLMMDLRDATGTDHEEKWNHAVFKYSTRFWQPDIDDPALVEGKTTIFANADDVDPAGTSSGMPAEVATEHGEAILRTAGHTLVKRTCRYRIRFRNDGLFDVGAVENAWHHVAADGVSTFAPRYAMKALTPSQDPRPGHDGNPLIARDEVLELLELRKEFSP
jgi:hypothetical protein